MMTKTFRILYFGVIGLIVVLFIAGAIAGLVGGVKAGEDPLGGAIMISVLALIFIGLPLFVVFLGLNIWGFVRYKSHRLRYGLVIILLSAWIAWSIDKCLTMPLP